MGGAGCGVSVAVGGGAGVREGVGVGTVCAGCPGRAQARSPTPNQATMAIMSKKAMLAPMRAEIFIAILLF